MPKGQQTEVDQIYREGSNHFEMVRQYNSQSFVVSAVCTKASFDLLSKPTT